MFKNGNLSSIPEGDPDEDLDRKWVPKKKHEVLKAKYKCLKKLFQIYDASVIGILPEPNPEPLEEKGNRRRKRSHRTKTDACAGTNEMISGDNTTIDYDNEHSSVATAIRELTIDQSCVTTEIDRSDKCAETASFVDKFDSSCELKNCHCHRLEQLNNQMQEKLYRDRLQAYAHSTQPYNMGFERRKLTRFQCFVQRLFGIRREPMLRRDLDGQLCAASDPILTSREKRRRRGLRFRRIRGRTKKVSSESALKDLRTPPILSYVQSVQKNCLMDTTPRKCPIPGCGMVSYGIINYNDHLNLCHFKDRKHVCLYCHEGFETELEKVAHENEHIGISKLGTNMSTFSTGLYMNPGGMSNGGGYLSPNGHMYNGYNITNPESVLTNGNNLCNNGTYKIASNTQTDPEVKIPEEKLKKIVSFFDKINDPEQILTEIKKNRYSDTNLRSKADQESSSGTGSTTERSDQTTSGKSQSTSCCNLSQCRDCKLPSSGDSDISTTKFLNTPYCCRFCGESFTCRRQLNLHVGSEHRTRYPKYHSCAGIVRPRGHSLSQEGSLNVHCVDNCSHHSTTLSHGQESLKCARTESSASECATRDVSAHNSSRKSEESLTCDPSTNIVYYTSAESLAAASVSASLAGKVRSYHWQPGTSIIRV